MVDRNRRSLLGNLLDWQGALLAAGVFSILRRFAAEAASPPGRRPTRTPDLARDDAGTGANAYSRAGRDRTRVVPPRFSVQRRG